MSLSLVLCMENFWNHFWRQQAQDNRFGEKSGAVSHITGSISLPTRIKCPGNGLTAPGHHWPRRWVAGEYHDTEVSTEVDPRGGMDWGRVGRNVQSSEWKILEAAVYTRQPKAPLWVLVYIRPLPCGDRCDCSSSWLWLSWGAGYTWSISCLVTWARELNNCLLSLLAYPVVQGNWGKMQESKTRVNVPLIVL